VFEMLKTFFALDLVRDLFQDYCGLKKSDSNLL
jgi:hypothetical protein